MGGLRQSMLAVLLAAGVSAVACSSAPVGNTTAATLMPEVQAAVNSATSVHLVGLVSYHSQTATIDLSFSGRSVAGKIGFNGQSFDLLSLDGKTYFKVDAAFLRAAQAPAIVCARVCGKYVEMPAASATQITGSLTMQQIVRLIFSNKNLGSEAASGCVFSPATLNGQPVLQCRQGPYLVDVAAHGKPYPAYISGPNGEYRSFSDWNAVMLPAAPSGSQLVSIPKLG